MGTLLKTASPVVGFRYYFSVLMGLCRGPIDEIVLIKSGGRIAWDGSAQSVGPATTSGTIPLSPYVTDPTSLFFNAAWAGGTLTKTTPNVPINRPDIYGGDKREGGLYGSFDALFGEPTQTLPTRIQAILGSVVSAFRGVTTVFWDGEVCANNPYPKPWRFRVRRALQGWDGGCWYPNKAVITLSDPAIPTYITSNYIPVGSGLSYDPTNMTQTYNSPSGSITTNNVDGIVTNTSTNPTTGEVQVITTLPSQYNTILAMNPAHILYECATNRDWGRGLDRSMLDDASFTSAANSLYTDNLGLCLKWTRSEKLEAFVQIVLDHIGGVIYTDRITGLLTLKLIRNDYNVATLPTFDYDSGLVAVTSVDSSSQDTSSNEVVVKYYSPVLDMAREARVQNIASVQALGSIQSVTHEYIGVPTSDLALRLAQRDLKALSEGLRRVEFKLDRRGYQVTPGSVVIVNSPDYGLNNIVLRVLTVEDSVVTDGTITISATQDQYALPTTTFIAPQPSAFIPVDRNPYPVKNQELTEATYRDVVRVENASFVDALDPKVSYVNMLAQAPTPSAYGFMLQTQLGYAYTTNVGPWTEKGFSRFVKLSTAPAAIGLYDTQIRVTGDFNSRTVVPGYAILLTDPAGIEVFRDEFVILDAITDNADGTSTLTVRRGCVDTPPLPHAAGAWVWAYDQTAVTDTTEYYYDDLVSGRCITRSTLGDLPEGQAPATDISVFSRVTRPYSGTNFQINGTLLDRLPNPVSGDMKFTWAHRDRKGQADQLVSYEEADVGPETGVFYGILVYGTGGTSSALAAPGYAGSSTTVFSGNTLTFTTAMANSANIKAGPCMVMFQTFLKTSSGIPIKAWRDIIVDFNYDPAGGTTAAAPSAGWSSTYGTHFGT